MSIDAESILIYTIYVMVLPYINTVAIMVGITTPYEIMPPKKFIAEK